MADLLPEADGVPGDLVRLGVVHREHVAIGHQVGRPAPRHELGPRRIVRRRERDRGARWDGLPRHVERAGERGGLGGLEPPSQGGAGVLPVVPGRDRAIHLDEERARRPGGEPPQNQALEHGADLTPRNTLVESLAESRAPRGNRSPSGPGVRLRRAGAPKTPTALDPSAILLPWSSPPPPRSLRRRNAPCRRMPAWCCARSCAPRGRLPARSGGSFWHGPTARSWAIWAAVRSRPWSRRTPWRS